MTGRRGDGEQDRHRDAGELFDLLHGLLDEASRQTIELHLSECAPCAELLGHVSRTDLLLENWTAEVMSEIRLRLLIPERLAAASGNPLFASWAKRLKRWGELSGRVQGAIGVAASDLNQLHVSFISRQRNFLAPGGWEFVPAVMGRTGAIRVATIRGFPEAKVEVRAEIRNGFPVKARVRVSIPGDLVGSQARIVVLTAIEGSGRTEIRELEQTADGRWTAEFSGLDAGNYVILLEPVPA